MKSKDKSNNSHSKRKKKIREINSYKFQFNTRIKHKANIDSKIKNKNKTKEKNKNIKYISSNSDISAKSFNQKPTSSLIRDYNVLSKNNNFNAISYSNIAFSDIEHIKKNENNILDESSKYNNEDNTLIQTNMTYSLSSNNNKMNISELNCTNKGKKTGIKSNKNSQKDIHDNAYVKKAAYSMINENKKASNQNMNNLSNKAIKSSFETSLKRFDNKLTNDINFKNLNKSSLDKNLKNKKKLEQYMSNSRKDIYENEKNNNNELINNKINNYNKKGSHVQNNISKINEEVNNSFNDSIFPSNNHNNANRNNKNYKINNYEQKMNSYNYEDEFVEDGVNFQFDGLEEKLQNLYKKIHGYKDDIPQLYPMEANDDANNRNQITYPNLRRYQRQKSEPNLRLIPLELDSSTFNNNYFIHKDINNNITSPKLIVNYPDGACDNKNLSKIKILEEKLKNENITKRKINTLLKEQDNPELINILSELQMTIKKLPKNGSIKEIKSISTLPANYLFPFDMYEQMKNIKSNSYFKITKNFDEKNKFTKAQKIKSKLKDFQEIINKTNKNKNYFNIAPKNKGFTGFYDKSRKSFANLCPVNYFENSIFNLDN